MGPAPEDAVGLRRWTVLLDPPDLDAVGQRVADAGIDSFGAADGNRVLVRDPWNNVLLLAARGAWAVPARRSLGRFPGYAGRGLRAEVDCHRGRAKDARAPQRPTC